MGLEIKTNLETIGIIVMIWGSFCGLIVKIFGDKNTESIKDHVTSLDKDVVELKTNQKVCLRDHENTKLEIRDIREIVSRWFENKKKAG